MPKQGPFSTTHSIPARGTGSILIGSFPEGLTSANRKDWLSALNVLTKETNERQVKSRQ